MALPEAPVKSLAHPALSSTTPGTSARKPLSLTRFVTAAGVRKREHNTALQQVLQDLAADVGCPPQRGVAVIRSASELAGQLTAPSRFASLEDLDEVRLGAEVCTDAKDTVRTHLPEPLAEDRAAVACPPSSAQCGRLFAQVEVPETGHAALGSECCVLKALETASQQAVCRSSPQFHVADEVLEDHRAMCCKDSIDRVCTFQRLNKVSTLRWWSCEVHVMEKHRRLVATQQQRSVGEALVTTFRVLQPRCMEANAWNHAVAHMRTRRKLAVLQGWCHWTHRRLNRHTWSCGGAKAMDEWARSVFCRGENAYRGHVHLCRKGHSRCHVSDLRLALPRVAGDVAQGRAPALRWLQRRGNRFKS